MSGSFAGVLWAAQSREAKAGAGDIPFEADATHPVPWE